MSAKSKDLLERGETSLLQPIPVLIKRTEQFTLISTNIYDYIIHNIILIYTMTNELWPTPTKFPTIDGRISKLRAFD